MIYAESIKRSKSPRKPLGHTNETFERMIYV